MMDAAFDTIWPSDSVEFCPGNPQNVFVCGTYKLDQSAEFLDAANATNSMSADPEKQHRRGKCLVFEIISGEKRDL
jgi:diphthamide biosynthesis protein 7